MNIHHLELFYYVARHGGITEAVRNMPYGIQQPAMSGQIIQLEESLGIALFQRRPFKLTPQGEELYAFIRPFFDNLDSVAAKLRGGEAQHIRIGASEVVLRDHLPAVLESMGKMFPRMKLTLREGYQPELEAWIARDELDLAITLLSEKLPPGTAGMPLFELPLVLLVSRNSPIKSAQELWARDRIDENLISLPTSEPIYKNFQEGLARLGVDWFTNIEVSTVELVKTYVANGHGIGLSIVVPKAADDPRIRTLPLEGFKPVSFGVLYHTKPIPIVQAFLQHIRQAAEGLGQPAALPPQPKRRKS
ncbi:MAG: LysR family transcriptional regulator [Verrucomicrobia subdivision 3 bacterium]|nr:LysR family transcriptional regulator [Limisphaerales bacterium]